MVVDGESPPLLWQLQFICQIFGTCPKKENMREGEGQTNTAEEGGERERERDRRTNQQRESCSTAGEGGGTGKTGRRVVKSAVLQVVSSSWLSVGKRRAALSQTAASLPTALSPYPPLCTPSLSWYQRKNKWTSKPYPFYPPHPTPPALRGNGIR